MYQTVNFQSLKWGVGGGGGGGGVRGYQLPTSHTIPNIA